MSYLANVAEAAARNENFRTVLFTASKSQLVVMRIPVGGDIGEETHAHVEQILYFQSGTGKAILDGKESVLSPGDVLVVTPGTKHNILNTGTKPLTIITIYVPPNHIDGTTHTTKADATADTKDETFGEKI